MSALSLQADIFLGFVVPETAGTFTQTLGPVQGLGRFFQQLGKGTFLSLIHISEPTRRS